MGLFEADPMHPAGPYSSERLFEWFVAITMVMIALTLSLPGGTMERGALKPLAEAGFSEENMSLFFGACGIARCFALYMNGHINNGRVFPNGANIRAFCALASAVVFGQFTLALLVDAIHANAPALNIPLFGGLTMFELLSCFIARKDAVRRKDTLVGQIEAMRAEAVRAGVSLEKRDETLNPSAYAADLQAKLRSQGRDRESILARKAAHWDQAGGKK